MSVLQYRFAKRLLRVPASFLDELFRVSADPSIISFAGGLPSSVLIDTAGISRATNAVLEEEAGVALQLPPLTGTSLCGNISLNGITTGWGSGQRQTRSRS